MVSLSNHSGVCNSPFDKLRVSEWRAFFPIVYNQNLTLLALALKG
jgi:hypothetical protein